MRDSGRFRQHDHVVFSPRRRALPIPEFDSCWIVNQIAPRQLAAVYDDDRRLSAISKIDLSAPDFGLWFPLTDDR
jgi:hypothetical protein